MRKRFLLKANVFIWLFVFVLFSFPVKGQSEIQISGRVTGEDEAPLAGVRVSSPIDQTVTNEKGAFICRVYSLDDMITLYKEGYETLEIQAGKVLDGNTVALNPDAMRSIPLLNRSKAESTLTGSVAYLKGDRVKNVPGTNRMNSLTGTIPGLWVNQSGGMPGQEWASLKIRGQNTFGPSNSRPTVLVDGIPGDISQLDPYDIESVTVLKDAASAVMYGLRSSQGVILIETRKGQPGDVKVNFNSQVSRVEPLRMPEFLGAYQYARLYNEAALNDGLAPKYDLDAIENGTDKYLFPDVNWVDETFRRHSFQTRNNLNISGGTDKAQYYFSLGYVTNDGLYNVDDTVNTYNTNSKLTLANIHTHVAVKLSEKLKVNVDLKANQDIRNNPGSFSENYENKIFNTVFGTSPLAHPVLNADGTVAGTSDYQDNVYGLLNHAGYSIWKKTFMSGKADITYDLGSVVDGLSLVGMYATTSNGVHITDRGKGFAVYEVVDPETINKIGQDTEMESTSQWGDNTRLSLFELGFRYKKSLGSSRVSGALLMDRQVETRRVARLPRVYQGVKGFLSLVNNNKYLADFSFAVQGSEQFPRENRYGFFPALSLGWILSEESFLSTSEAISFLKLRGSAGITGNDFEPYASGNPYFAYLDNYSRTGAYSFGETVNGDGGFREEGVGNNAITWEKVRKYNVGIDAAFFDSKLSLSANYFYEKTHDILVDGANPKIFGASFWYPVGEVENKGVDGMITLRDTKGKFSYFVSANATLAKNKILEQAEEARAYDWMERTGHPIGSKFGYVFDRYFTEEDDFSSLPDQSQLGSVQPGDLKYRDLSGDGIIDEEDMTLVGKSGTPEFFYGFSGGFSFGGFDVSVLFQGISGIERYYKDALTFEFLGGKGNVNSRHLQAWTPGSGQSAGYPRLSIGSAQNNRVNSDYWLKDASYLRLKSLEVGYTVPAVASGKIGLSGVRVYVAGYNLMTWDDIEFTDPESAANGIGYPVARYLSAGLNISF